MDVRERRPSAPGVRNGLRAARPRAARADRRLAAERQGGALAWFGAAAAGLVYTPLNTAYKGALLEEALNLLRARVLVVACRACRRLAARSAT